MTITRRVIAETFKQSMQREFKEHMKHPKVVPKLGSTYVLRKDPILGDYSGLKVKVVLGEEGEKGPRGEGNFRQVRVRYGPGSYEVDWIHMLMFYGSTKVK